MIKRNKKFSNPEDEPKSLVSQAVKGGKYRKKEPPPSRIAEYASSSITRHPTAVKRSEHVLTAPGSSGNKSLRSLSVPSLHATAEKVKYSPPSSPPKPRSKSVRVNAAAKKASSFKKSLKKLLQSSTLDLDEESEQKAAGTYRPLGCSRPRSIGGSSDCSNSSTYTNDFSRCNSLRDSSRSRVSHGNDSVFQGHHQVSLDSNDGHSNNHAPSGSTDSTNWKPQPLFNSSSHPRSGIFSGGGGVGEAGMQRSSSSTSLKNFGIQTKVGVMDPRYHSVATDVPYLEEAMGGINLNSSSSSIGIPRRPLISKHYGIGRPSPMEDNEILWDDSKSFSFNSKSVIPSDPEYRKVAENLMSASPTHKISSDSSVQTFSGMGIDPRRMSDAGMDPRRASMDSGVESSSAIKHNRSLPTTPIASSFATAHAHNGGDAVLVPSREGSSTPHGYHSQENTSLPHGWEIAYTQQGLCYYLDHNTETTHWELPYNPDDSLGLPNGWEAVRSGQFGTYYVNHNDKTAIYQHPYHSRPPPPYQRPLNLEEEDDSRGARGDRKTPARSHSHRSSQSHRVFDPNSSLLRRSKSVRDQEILNSRGGGGSECSTHERQLSVVTYVPPNPYQSKEIPKWLKEYVETPFGTDLDRDMSSQWHKHSYSDLTGWDTMIKRLMKRDQEHIVRACEYYRVAIQQEKDDRAKERYRYELQQQQQHQHVGVGEEHSYLQQQQQQQQQQQHSHHIHRTHQHTSPQYYQHSMPSSAPSSASSSFGSLRQHKQQQQQQLPAAMHSAAHLNPGPTHHSIPMSTAASAAATNSVTSPQQKAPPPHTYYHHHQPHHQQQQPHPHHPYAPPPLHLGTSPSSSAIISSSSTITPSTSAVLPKPHPLQAPPPSSPHYAQRSPSLKSSNAQAAFAYQHDRNVSSGDGGNSSPPANKYDTMIAKTGSFDGGSNGSNRVSWGKNMAYGYAHSPGNNGLRRVDSEGLPHTIANSQMAAAQSGMPHRAISTDHVATSRQSGAGFTDLFDGGSNVQETFV